MNEQRPASEQQLSLKIPEIVVETQRKLMSPAATPKTAQSFLSVIKRLCWRFTAAYFWLHSFLLVLAGHDQLAGPEHFLASKFISVLTMAGFAPVNVGHLSVVLLATWILVITGFSLPQILVGFPLYVFVFPFTAFIVLVYHGALQSDSSSAQANPFMQGKKRFRLVPLAVALLVGWFLLYGGSSARAPNIVGFFLSFVVFIALTYRALDMTSPIENEDTAFFSTMAMRGLLIVLNAFQKAAEERPKTKLQIASALRVNGFLIKGVRMLGALIYGRKGRERISKLMLLEYIVFLVVVAASAILFWALAIKAVVPSEQALPLTAALQASASQFLPSLQDPMSTPLPWWARLGPALTSWILFVIYIGPVGAALPVRQEAFMKRLMPAQKAFRLTGQFWRFYKKIMNTMGEKLTDAA